MVMFLPPPAACGAKLVDDIVAERRAGRNGKFFRDISDEWRERVEAYSEARGSPAQVPVWPEIEEMKPSFLTLYEKPAKGSVQGAMLTSMRAHGLMLCPGCGEAGRPNTLDHYLPKGKYPHLCVTPQNLFPMCDVCQGAKGSKTGDHVDARFFIHPYYDAFAADQVLVLTITPPFSAPEFELSPAPVLKPDEIALVRAHVRELRIRDRYAEFFKGQHRFALRWVDEMRRSGQDVALTLDGFRKAARSRGPNMWEHVYYDAVMKDAALLNYLCNEPLPGFL